MFISRRVTRRRDILFDKNNIDCFYPHSSVFNDILPGRNCQLNSAEISFGMTNREDEDGLFGQIVIDMN
jgi:hypothetical protein